MTFNKPEYNRAHYLKNAERYRKYQREYYKANRERILADKKLLCHERYQPNPRPARHKSHTPTKQTANICKDIMEAVNKA